MIPETAQSLMDLLATWVTHKNELRALALVGSWARGEARPESDLDLLVLAEPQFVPDDSDWIAAIGFEAAGFQLIGRRKIKYGVVTSHHLFLDPPAEVELSFAAPDWTQTRPIDPGTAQVVRGGFKILIDKDGRMRRLADALRVSAEQL